MRYRGLVSVLSLAAAFVVTAGLCFEHSSAQDERREVSQTKRRKFMRSKLQMVQKVVEGIATEDFDLVKDGGLELAALSESANWYSTRDPFYDFYSSGFEHSVRGLLAAAESESVERTTFAYVHVTMSCTACHQHVREKRRVAN